MTTERKNKRRAAKGGFPKEFNIPNALTFLRLVFGGIFFYFLLYHALHKAVIVFLIAALTDFLDGHVARKYGTVTDFGKFFDGFADKIFMLLVLLGLLLRFDIPLVYIFMILTRDIFVSVGALVIMIRVGSISKIRKVNFSSRKLGKITTFLQIFTVLLILLKMPFVSVFAYGTSIVGLFATIDYFIEWKEHIDLD